MPGLVPVRWFCRVTEEEVEKALMPERQAMGKKRPPQRPYLEKVFFEIDALLRDPHFDPFLVGRLLEGLRDWGVRRVRWGCGLGRDEGPGLAWSCQRERGVYEK